MAFTPTKWTHHFGVYAGLAAALAAVTAVAVGGNGIRVHYLRSLFAAAVLFLVAFCFTGSNGWWYVSGYGVRWPDRAPLLGGTSIAALIFALGVLCLLVAARQYYREPYRETSSAAKPFDRIAIRPLTLAAAVLVLFEVGTMTAAAWSQYPAYSVALSNLRALQGHPCALADDVLVETTPEDSLLQPYTGTPADGLSADNTGFTPNGVGDLAPEGAVPGGGSGGGTQNPRPHRAAAPPTNPRPTRESTAAPSPSPTAWTPNAPPSWATTPPPNPSPPTSPPSGIEWIWLPHNRIPPTTS